MAQHPQYSYKEQRHLLKLTNKIARLRKGLPILDLAEITFLLLCEVAKKHEDDPNGAPGEETIDRIADQAKQAYQRIIKYVH